MTVADYELMAMNMQELRRYIREVQEVVVYYRNVTIKDQPAVGAEIIKKNYKTNINIRWCWRKIKKKHWD